MRGFIGTMLIVRDLPAHVPMYDWLFLLVGGLGVLALGIAMRDRLAPSAAVEAERRSGTDRRRAAR